MPPNAALGNAVNLARSFHGGAAGCGVTGFETAAGLLLTILEHLQTVKGNKSALKSVIDELTSLLMALRDALEDIRALSGQDDDTLARLHSDGALDSRIMGLVSILQSTADQLPLDSGRIWNVLSAKKQKDTLTGMANQLNRASRDFSTRDNISIQKLILHAMRSAHEDKERRVLEEFLQRLPHADAAYSSSRLSGPLRGTREDLFADVDAWATRDSSVDAWPTRDSSEGVYAPLYALTGGAGTGKSTIAYEVARRAEERRNLGQQGQLAASFFFSRTAADLNSTQLVFPTLAWQMLSTLPAIRSVILGSHVAHGHLSKLHVQVEELFVKPLAALPKDHPSLVVVFDAVDECIIASGSLVQHMLFLLMEGLSRISCSIRIFLTARPEVHIARALRHGSLAGKVHHFRVSAMGESITDRDIRLYLISTLATLPEGLLTAVLHAYPNAIEDLVKQAGGSFIYASTVVEYLRSRGPDVVAGASSLFADDRSKAKPAPTHLGSLYIVVLNETLKYPSSTDFYLLIQKNILGCIAVLQDSLSPRSLATLTGLDLNKELFPILRRLSPVLTFSNDPDVPVRILHTTFSEFLVDPYLCPPPYLVSEPNQHMVLATYTLSLLASSMGTLHSLGRSHDLSPVPHSRIRRPVPPPVLYSCFHWPLHACYSLASHTEDAKRLELATHVLGFFLSERCLLWLEVLGYADRLDIAVQWLPELRRIFSEHNPKLNDVLYDVHRAIVEFEPAIMQDPQQIYVSAIPQCPDRSLLRRYIPQAIATPTSLLPYPDWPRWTTTDIISRFATNCIVRPSPDGQWVAVCMDNTIQLRTTLTGLTLKTFAVDDKALVDFGFSSDSRFIVSATCDSRVVITDCLSGTVLTSVEKTSGVIHRVAFTDGNEAILLAVTRGGFGPLFAGGLEHLVVFDWDELRGQVYYRGESRGLDRIDDHIPSWTISKDGQWGLVLCSGHLVNVSTFEVWMVPFTTSCSAVADWLSDNRVVCAIEESGHRRLLIFDAETRRVHHCVSLDYDIRMMHSSLDGTIVAMSGVSPDGRACLCVWNPANADEAIRVVDYVDPKLLCVSPDGASISAILGTSWAVMSTSRLEGVQPRLFPFPWGLKLSAKRSTVMVGTLPWSHSSGGRRTVVSSVDFSRPSSPASVIDYEYRHVWDGTLWITADPQRVLRLSGEEIALLSSDGRKMTFSFVGKPGFSEGVTNVIASVSPNMSLVVAVGTCRDNTLSFLVWDAGDGHLLHAFTTSRPNLVLPVEEDLIVTEDMDICLLQRDYKRCFTFRHNDWSVPLRPDEPLVIPLPDPHPISNEWFQLHDDGWVTRSDIHPNAHSHGQQKLFWVPPSHRTGPWRNDENILALTSDYNVQVLDLSAFDQDVAQME